MRVKLSISASRLARWLRTDHLSVRLARRRWIGIKTTRPIWPWSLDRERAETGPKGRESGSEPQKALVRPIFTQRIEVMRQRSQPRTTVSSASPISSARSVARVTVEAKPTGNGMPTSCRPRLDLRTDSFWPLSWCGYPQAVGPAGSGGGNGPEGRLPGIRSAYLRKVCVSTT